MSIVQFPPSWSHFVLSPVLLASRDQDGGPSNSTIADIYDLTEKYIEDCKQFKLRPDEPLGSYAD